MFLSPAAWRKTRRHASVGEALLLVAVIVLLALTGMRVFEAQTVFGQAEENIPRLGARP